MALLPTVRAVFAAVYPELMLDDSDIAVVQPSGGVPQNLRYDRSLRRRSQSQ